ncbi:MAG: 2Fe-2S iron-sulfur cluster-binding protein [Pseudomonadota bacterium]
MLDFFINGQPVQAEDNQTVMQAALANGFFIPYFCWHPQLSVPGNCRICMVEVEGDGGGWTDIACNMPITCGMRVLTDSDRVRAHRKQTMQFITLNHPVDCGICDKSGECTLQDYHYEYNGEPSISLDVKVNATKFYPLSERIVLDNERCILCTRCVRFTREVSKSFALGVQNRSDHSLIRAVEDGAFEADLYSDNVIDICPVGALLSRQFLHKGRVWYLKPTPSVCPGCERGCNINIWHRKSEWRLKNLDQEQNARIDRVTPLENPSVNGSWICNKARDLARVFERARAEQAMQKGRPVELSVAITAARALIAAAKQPVALVSSWGTNEELSAFSRTLGNRFTCHVKSDWQPTPGERLEDELLIRPDKNPNGAAARALFPSLSADVRDIFPPDTDLVFVWGEGFNFANLPHQARIIHLDSWLQPENGHADVFLPISVMTERSGHYTNFQGVVSGFQACFTKKPTVIDAQTLFEALATTDARVPS